MKKCTSYILLFAVFCIQHEYATTLVKTFNYAINQKVYDRASATLYVGLATQDDPYSIWACSRPIGNENPTFSSIIGSDGIAHLALATNLGNKQPYLGYNQSNNNPTYLYASTYNGKKPGQTALNDAAENATSLISALAGMLQPGSDNQGYFFAAVSASYTNTESEEPIPFGQPDSGIAVVRLFNDTSSTTLTLEQTAAESTAPTTVQAKRLDPSTEQVRINSDPSIDSLVTLHWDDHLQRLYTGLTLTTSAGANNGAKAVVVGQVHDNETLTLYDIFNTAALPAGDTDRIIAVINDSDQENALSIKHIRTMHCSTGPSYLIVNGDVGAYDQVNNTIYALPLVDICPESPYQGTLADKNAALSYRHTFETIVTSSIGLIDNDDAAVLVGAGPLPIESTTEISDIEVIGDTVYVSTATGQSATNESGILYSQALFEKTGKIVRWTPWTKRAFPYNAFEQESSINKGVQFFAVDAVTGKIWAVDGYTQKSVRVTAWDKGNTCQAAQENICPSSSSACCSTCNCCTGKSCSRCSVQYINTQPCCTLAAQVCASLPCGCYSVLDLDQSTRGFTESDNLNRFALFGGCGKVDIARISVAYNQTATSPQEVIEDFCPPTGCQALNFLETILPDNNVCVTTLEYSRPSANDPDNQCYFFAGTDKGLYVYANAGIEGFDLSSLTMNILARGQWIHISAFSDPIIDIKTTGLSLYILTQTAKTGTLISSLYRVDFNDTVEAMFDATNIHLIAQTGNEPFERAYAFTGIQPVAVYVTDNNEIEAEQLLLGTNAGLFGSYATVSAATRGVADAIDQADAAWALVPMRNTLWIEGIAGIDTPIPSTAWPISVEDICNSRTYEHSWIYQISSISQNTPSTEYFKSFSPTFFNSIVRNSTFEWIDPITYFWSDGARRFFIINRTTCKTSNNALMSFPFNTPEWHVCAPGQNVLVFDPYVVATKRFFWVKQIGITGILMAGTQDGVIALE
jgi:hypothetical protein